MSSPGTTNSRMCLKVVVQSGRFEASGDMQDPICRVTLGKQVHDTPPGEGCKPRWKTNFIFCYGKSHDLRFDIIDNDVSLGAVEVDLDTLTSRADQSYRGKIELPPLGTLRVELKILPFKRGLDGKPAEAAPPPLGEESTGCESRERPLPPRTMPQFQTKGGSDDKKGLLLLMPELEGANAIASLWGDLASDAAPPPKREPEFFVLKEDDLKEDDVHSAAADGTSSGATSIAVTRVGSAARTASATRGTQRAGSTSSNRGGSFSMEQKQGMMLEGRRFKRQTVHIPSSDTKAGMHLRRPG